MGGFLVTGGAGFIGSNLVHALVARAEEVPVLDNFSTGREENRLGTQGKISTFPGPPRDPDCAARAGAGMGYVLQEGALPAVPRSVEDPIATNQTNVLGTLNLRDAARRAGVKRVVDAASSAAYGETPERPKIETMRPDPLSPYAASKLAG